MIAFIGWAIRGEMPLHQRSRHSLRSGKKPFFRYSSAMCLAACGLEWATTGFSQQSVAVQADGTNSTSDSLTEIIVTAERLVTTVQKSSLAIEVLSGDELRDAGVTDAKQLTQIVPGLQVAKAGSNVSIFIRGIGESANNSVANPAVETNVDDVYIARESAVAGQFYDLQRVEVLKGPQGTLYGRNATGGAINIITNNPNFDRANLSAAHSAVAKHTPRMVSTCSPCRQNVLPFNTHSLLDSDVLSRATC